MVVVVGERGADPEERLALAGVEIVRPRYAADVEVTIAVPAVRRFPTRVSDSLGICLKRGPAHRVDAGDVRLTYPRDSVCIRPPGCVWSSEAGSAGFVAVDIPPRLLPESGLSGPMTFTRPAVGATFAAALLALKSADSSLAADEIVVQMVSVAIDAGLVATETPLASGGRGAVRRAREFLAESFDQRPTLDEVARSAEVNKFVLIREFRKTVGTTPHAYLVLLRLDRSRALLARGDSASDVARASGFADQAHLTRWFSRVYGVTPQRYARQVRRA